ncbi:MAG: filamentous hemagglutinin N-terminal domain-containing protein [Nostoc sp.]|uniref:two-partner secretion domain-containing protein n=1 Tax=Nostoc sp. TaxID=1180 RepID=UPI002FF6604D
MNQVHHSEKASIKSIIYLLCLVSTAFRLYSPAQAQIIPDNTLGAEASQLKQNVLTNGALGDKIEGGAARGGNLFHSFSEFNIPDGQRVYFANPIGIENILTRVTGGNASNIFGTLGVNGAANLFLINPNGILFGQNARLDVQGSFVGTTANGVQFGNQGLFSATNPQAPPLLTIQPSALWFNQLNQNAGIQNNSVAAAGIDSSGVSRFGLRVPDGKSLLLVGGNVSIDGGRLNALGGRVELGGLAAPGNVNLLFNGDNLSLKFPLNVTRADVSLINDARVYVQGFGGGDIAVNARNVEILSGSALYAGIWQGLGKPEIVAGDITVNGTGEIKVAGSGSEIGNLVRSGSKGNAGNITIDAGDFSLQDGARLYASTYGQGNAGNVTVGAKNAVDLAGQPTAILSTVEAGGVGKAGNIDINATSLSLTDGAQLQSGIRAASSTQPAGRGDAGNVNVKVTGVVDITGEKNDFPSGIRSNVETGTVGNGGNIFIDSGDFSLRDGAKLVASTYGEGNAGNVTVGAKNVVSLVNGDILSAVEAGGVGKGGNININATSLSLTDGAQLLTITRAASATQPAGRGDAGNVNVKVTGVVDITGEKNDFPSGIRSNVETGTVGNGGNIFIDSGDFSLDGAQVNASTFGQGNAGNVTVGAKNAISLAGSNSSIFSIVGAGGDGKGGNININARSLSLANGAQIATSTIGKGNAGNIQIHADDSVFVTNGSVIQAVSFEQGNAGSIIIEAGNSISFDGVGSDNPTGAYSAVGSLAIPSPEFTGKRSGGDITIAAQRVSLINSAQLLASTFGQGNGGNIFIDSGLFSLRDGAQLNASTFGQGNAGNVTVSAKDAVSLANANIFSAVEAGGVGKGGNIDINAATLSLTDGAQLLTITHGASATQPAGRGDAGNVNVKVIGAVDIAGEKNGFPSGIRSLVGTGAVGNGGNIFIDSGLFSLRDGAQLNASTFGQGNAGNVTVGAKNAIYLANSNIFSTVEAGGVGKGGNIDINAATLSLTDGAQLLTITRGASDTQPAGRGDAGNVNVTVTGAVDIAGEKNGFPSGIRSLVDTGTVGNGGNIFIDSGDFSLRDGALLNASTYGVGNAGNIRINAKDAVTVSGTNQETGLSSALFTFTDSTSTGKGGDITVNTNIFRISDGALLDANTANNQKGGDITVNANLFEALNGGQLTTTTSSNGRAGKITVNANDKLTISGIDPSYNDRSTNFPDNVVNIGANSGLFVSSTGSGITGDIEVNSPQITLDNQGKLNAESASGNGGNINVNSDLLLLRHGAQISTNAGTAEKGGDGGNININSRFIIAIPEENSDISANAFTGTGGNIQINSQGIFGIQSRPKLTNKSDITASSELGVSGVTNINAPDNSYIQNSFTELSPNVIDTNALIANSCISRGTKRQENSFTITGSGALRNSPGNGLVSAYTTGEVRGVEQTSRTWKKGDPIIEPQGLYRLPNGQLILSRSCSI